MSKVKYWDYVKTLPEYLGAFAIDQNYDRYTPENQATWRFIMRQLKRYLGENAHQVYLDGLEKTNITIDKIPDIEEMLGKLKELGWGAIIVDGFIPPAAFMEYNAHRVLPISAEMRTLDHLLYTPAPDIVHEAAGHAPIVADKEYADFLQKVGEYGAKALSNSYDQKVYEAIRKLSIVKEHPNSTEEEINDTQRELDEAITERDKHPKSEAGLISRFHWWTVEYGLVGEGDDLKIYGAGLLSSLGESRHCLKDVVNKIELSIDCLDYQYDITTMQPQLFYAKTWKHLFNVLEEIADSMAFRQGGCESVDKAITCASLSTVKFENELCLSGIITEQIKHNDNCAYIKFTGPTSISYQGKELDGHGGDYHQAGYSTPVGKLKNATKALYEFDEKDFKDFNIIKGQQVTLEYESGVQVIGQLDDILAKDNKNLLFTFSNCTVTGPNNETLFLPDWGNFDMALGSEITSVFGGPGDKNNYDFESQKSDYCMEITYSEDDKKAFKAFTAIREVREAGGFDLNKVNELLILVNELAPNNWLLKIEILELFSHLGIGDEDPTFKKIHQELDDLKVDDETHDVINLGLELL